MELWHLKLLCTCPFPCVIVPGILVGAARDRRSAAVQHSYGNVQDSSASEAGQGIGELIPADLSQHTLSASTSPVCSLAERLPFLHLASALTPVSAPVVVLQ